MQKNVILTLQRHLRAPAGIVFKFNIWGKKHSNIGGTLLKTEMTSGPWNSQVMRGIVVQGISLGSE